MAEFAEHIQASELANLEETLMEDVSKISEIESEDWFSELVGL